jgi:glycosyltransferase involved in cell wall biosynthesis
MFEKSQQEIIENWKDKMPLVSICCVTYNHEKYIEEALNGFLMQEADFPFEILIHDDASTDRTAEIIKNYEKKYSKLFRPVYQEENQKSKLGSGMNPTFNYPRARGKYIALCDGDDYWTDPLKLQKQVDFMEANEEYSFCFHNAEVVYENRNRRCHLFKELENRKYDIEELILRSWFVPTQSILFRSNLLEMPKWINYLHGGDYALQLILADKGPLYCMPDTMGVYRKNDESVSATADFTKVTKYLMNVLTYFDYYSNYKYHNLIEKRKETIINDTFSLKRIVRIKLRQFLRKYIK